MTIFGPLILAMEQLAPISKLTDSREKIKNRRKLLGIVFNLLLGTFLERQANE